VTDHCISVTISLTAFLSPLVPKEVTDRCISVTISPKGSDWSLHFCRH